MKALILSSLISVLFSFDSNAHTIKVIEVFNGTQYSNQLEMPFNAIQPQLKLSDISQNLTPVEIENFYTFRHSLESQKHDLHHLALFLLSRSIYIGPDGFGFRPYDHRFEQLLVPFFAIVISF